MRLEFGINEFTTHPYVEDAACSFHQSRLLAECVFQLGSETRRRWQVVSGAAVSDANIHIKNLLVRFVVAMVLQTMR